MGLKKSVPGILLALCGIGCLLAGLLDDGYRQTLMKAARVCLECVGIG